MTPNDISTPKKAEDAPRHPLALLDLLLRVHAAAQAPGEEHEDLAGQFTQVMADPATGEQLQALRAQAEAEMNWDAAVARLMQGGNLVLMARGDRWDVAQLLRDAAEKIEEGVREFHDESCQEGLWFRAALAQAGGEG